MKLTIGAVAVAKGHAMHLPTPNTAQRAEGSLGIEATTDSFDQLVPTLLSLSKSTRALMGIRLAELSLHQGQDELLMALDVNETLSVSVLSDKLYVRPSTVSKMLDRLCAKDLVVRTSTPDDARRTMVKLTDKGVDAKRKVRQMWDSLDSELSTRLATDGDRSIIGALTVIDDIIATRLARLR